MLRYADVLYTMGGSKEQIATARKYYARALELSQGSSARALYGIAACRAQLKALGAQDDEAGSRLSAVAVQAIEEIYRAGGVPEHVSRIAADAVKRF